MDETTHSTPGPDSKPSKPKKLDRTKEAKKILAELRERYPKAFTDDPEAVMPLAIYIHNELTGAGYKCRELCLALKLYANTPAYLAALAAAKPRVNLDGEPVGFVSEFHQQEAATGLANPGTRPTKRELWKAAALAGRAYTAGLNPKSFRRIQNAFKETAQPVAIVSGSFNRGVSESAAINLFDKDAKPEPAKAPEPLAAAPGSATGRQRLGLKPGAGA